MLMCKMQSHLKAFTNIYTLKLLKILGHKIIIMNDMGMNHSLHIGTYVEYDIVYIGRWGVPSYGSYILYVHAAHTCIINYIMYM